MKNNRKCICCSTEYAYCNRCNKDINLPSWYALFHDENCKKIFEIARNYYDKTITKEVAKEQFSTCDLSNINNFSNSIARAIEEVFFEEIVECLPNELKLEPLTFDENVFEDNQVNEVQENIQEENLAKKSYKTTKIKAKASVKEEQ